MSLLLCSLSIWAISDYGQQFDDVKTDIKLLNESLSISENSKVILYKQLKQKLYTISQLNNMVFDLEKQLRQIAQELTTLSKIKLNQQNSEKKQIDVLLSQVRSVYIKFQNIDIKNLLDQRNPVKSSRIMTYYRYICRARKQQLVGLKNSLKTLTHKENNLFAIQKNLRQLHRQQQKKQRALLSTTKQIQEKLIFSEKEILGQDSQLKLLEKDEYYSYKSSNSKNKLFPEIERLRQQVLSEYQPFYTRLGSLTWPVKGELLVRYGEDRNIGKLTWNGIIISALTGDNIVASAPGKVIFADLLRGFGLLIIVDHGEQYMTLYANNKALLKKVGEIVYADDPIAQSGMQGMHECYGLYFEIRHKGKPINPLKWLKKIS